MRAAATVARWLPRTSRRALGSEPGALNQLWTRQPQLIGVTCTAGLRVGLRSAGGLSIDWGIPLSSDGPVTPVTLLSGFLGAGKTTLLKNLLENKKGLRIGVVVNDVASVNVDAQLISSQVAGAEGIEVAELQNGCVCCSLADDLFSSVSEILVRAPPGSNFDHILVELSGVGEPESIRRNWRMAREIGHPAALRSEIAKVVTVVDASTFAADWQDGRAAAELGDLGDRHDSSGSRPVVELLAEQIESADLILLSKVDLASVAELKAAAAIVRAINLKSEMLTSLWGKVDPARTEGGPISPPALAGLLRAKGVCWLTSELILRSEPLHEHLWSFAGRRASISKRDPWWGACTEQQWRAAYPGQDVYKRVRQESWDESGEWGDRQTAGAGFEIVFIGGREMDEEAGLGKTMFTKP
ncbi:unnamed protein product [Polarella glacialis]|uniref:CobW C-terminal domain-containing protein n=1 Tax=Polarella glacialis TaxID=89957 RepID=A0A813HF25_POLGL|nr:unnamed protein product [Polarella glacialis]